MRRLKQWLLIAVTALMILQTTGYAIKRQVTFTDLGDHWSKSMVYKLVDEGIISGYGDGTFRPDDTINADEFIKIVITALGYSISPSDDYWAKPYIEKAIELGMVDEGEYDSFSRPITRAEMAKIISMALKNPPQTDLTSIKAKIYDYAETPEVYKEYVLTAYNEKIITGYEDDSFRPNSNVTRAEAAVIVIRLIDKNGGMAAPGAQAGTQAGTQTGTSAGSGVKALYVATNGNDNNDGSESSPLKTIQKANDTVRQMKQGGTLPADGLTVYLRGGIYYQYDSLVFDDGDSGTENGKITYTSYPGESVRLSGSKPIDKSWFKAVSGEAKDKIIDKKAAEKVFVADLKSNGITDYGDLNTRGYHYFNKGQYMAAELIVNGENQTLARYPNTGTTVVNNANLNADDLSFRYDDERPGKWAKEKDVWICGTLSINYENNYYPVEKIDTSNKTIKLREGKIQSYYTNGFYFAENLPEEIDQAGEYYIDRDAGLLYYLPPDDFMTGDYTVELSTLCKPMFQFNGASNIAVTNITMEAGRGYAALGMTAGYHMMTYGEFLAKNNITVEGKPQYFDNSKFHIKVADPKNYPNAEVFPGHLWDGFLDDGAGVTGIEFKNCEIRDFGQGGLIFRGTKVKLEHNEIKNIGGTGIYLTGGNLETLESSENTIVGNLIHRIGYQHRAYNPGIAIQGVGCRVAYNDLYDAPHCILNYHGNDHIIEYNKIHDAVKECLDMDAIYTRNEYIPEWRGTVIRYNYIYNMGIYPVGDQTKQMNVSGIRTDNYGHALQIYNNIFANIGTAGANSVIAVTAQGNRNMLKDNLFIDCAQTYRGWDTYSPGNTWDTSKQDVADRLALAKKYSQIPIFAEKYPELATFQNEFYAAVATNVFDENVVVNLKFGLSQTNGSLNPSSTRGAPELIQGKNNVVTAADPGFIDYKSGDYELKADSDIFKKIPNFKNLKMSEFGPQEAVGPAK